MKIFCVRRETGGAVLVEEYLYDPQRGATLYGLDGSSWTHEVRVSNGTGTSVRLMVAERGPKRAVGIVGVDVKLPGFTKVEVWEDGHGKRSYVEYWTASEEAAAAVKTALILGQQFGRDEGLAEAARRLGNIVQVSASS